MAKEPWFKAWSADILTDEKMDAMPAEAEGLLWRMWCVCNLRGCISADPEEIARLTCRKTYYVSKYVSYMLPFFDLRDGHLFSHRMEREKQKSEMARRSRSFRKDSELEERASERGTNRASERGTQKARKLEDQKEQDQKQDQNLLSDPSSDDIPLHEMKRKDDHKIPVRRVFDYYREKVGKTAAYSLTPARMKKGLARFEEAPAMCLALRPTLKLEELPDACEKLMRYAVDRLAESDWHMGRDAKTDGKTYNEWEENLFKNAEQFQKWIERLSGAKA